MGTCSGDSAAFQLQVTNTGNSDGYFDIEYKLTLNGTDVSNWNTLYDGNSITSGQTKTYTTTALEHGYQLSWRVRSGLSNPSSGTYTSAGTGLTVSCITDVTLTASQSLGGCSAASGYQTSTLSLSNSSGSTAYVTVEYSTDGGSSWTVHDDAEEADNLSITSGSSNTSLTVNVLSCL